MKGEDRQDLGLDELQKLEKWVEASLGCVIVTKGAELLEANKGYFADLAELLLTYHGWFSQAGFISA
ncbi:hypothetical protein C1H46_007504 [Malus baccata]|uniref:Uncharacterized protein n=1 Tax=Malus baccata TaxID=106549 RepID=A0A540N744_MALBA|nr:hypothetical protein C1H46_007504 [Malus baccata]